MLRIGSSTVIVFHKASFRMTPLTVIKWPKWLLADNSWKGWIEVSRVTPRFVQIPAVQTFGIDRMQGEGEDLIAAATNQRFH
jgi:hypothetical protein